jgi:hypothetical protein
MMNQIAPTEELPALGVIAPAFIALAIAAGILDIYFDSRALVWLGLGFLALGLSFSHYTRRLLDRTGLRSPHGRSE